MARTVTLSLLGLNRLSKPLKRAGKDVDSLDDKIDDFNESGEKLSKSFDSAAKSAGKLGEADKALEKVRAAAAKAKQQVTKTSEALDKARSGEASAAAKTAAAEAKLAQVRSKSKASAEQIRAAELQVTAAKVKEEAATKAVTARSTELTKARARAAEASKELTVASRQAAEANRLAIESVDSDRVERSRGGLLGLVGALGSVGGAGGKMAGSMGKAFGSISSNVWIMVAIVAAALAALPAVAAATGALMAVGFGAGIVGVGLVAAAQSKKVKDTFSSLKEDVVADLKSMAEPLEGTLVDAAGHMRGAFNKLSPSLEQAFSDAAPVLSKFSQQLFSSLGDWGPVIDSASDAFTNGMAALGPEMKSRLGEIGDSLKSLFDTVAANPQLFSGLVGGVLGFVNGLIKLVHWLTRVYLWVQEKLPGGMMTLLSPLASLWLHLGKTGGSAAGLGERMAEMGNAFKSAWGFISGGAKDLFATVKPIFNQLRNALASSDAITKVQEWWGQIADIIRLAGELIGTILHRLADVIGGVWNTVGANILEILSGLWTAVKGIISGALKVIKGILNVFIGVLTGDWARAWKGVKQIFAGLWQAIVGILKGAWQIVVGLVKGLINAIVGVFKWLWKVIVGNSIIPDLINGILKWFRKGKAWVVAVVTGLRDRAVKLFANIRDWVLARIAHLKARARLLFHQARVLILKTVLGLRNTAVKYATQIRDWIVDRVQALRAKSIALFRALRAIVLAVVTALRDRAVRIFTTVRDWIVSRARALRDRVVDAFQALKDRSIDAFQRAKDGIKRVWGKVKEAAKKPVNFIIGTVYGDGIKKFWDSIAGKIGMGDLPKIKELATGGVLSGYRPGKDTVPAMLSEGEGVLVPQAVRSLGTDFVHKANALKGRAAEMVGGAQGFAKGGIAGAVGDFLAKGKNHFAGGFKKALNAVTGPMTDTLSSKFGRSGFTGLPVRAVEHLIGKVKEYLKPFASQLSGGNGKKVVEVAKKYIGLSGNPNKFTRRMGMNGLPWCGMFVDGVFDEANASKALKGVTNPAAVRSYRSLPKVSPSQARPGDLPLYRGDDGHINIFAGNNRTVGGNESNSVRWQAGYWRGASSIRRPQFAKGGVVTKRELLNVLAQDRATNNRRSTPMPTNLMRAAADMRHYRSSRMVTDAQPIARALGGPTVPGQTYRVGERGPEEMTVGTRAQVTPIEYGNHYEITVNVPANADKAAVGKATVEAIQEYERRSGKRWRK